MRQTDLSGRVAIVTGAGGGLGRSHALLLAQRGAKVVVNDVGSATSASGGSVSSGEQVAAEIRVAGGEAVSSNASVTDPDQIASLVAETVNRWGRVDILVNNAGILRDKTFAKMSLEDFRTVLDVHVMGSVNCTKAVWNLMRNQRHGRIVMTTSSSGLYGNFGQSNYSAAKLALVGLMQTLGLEGERYNIRVNCIAPTAATGMLEGLMPRDALDRLSPSAVSPAVLALVAEDAPNRMILCAGAGAFERAHITLTRGVHIGCGENAAEQILERIGDISDRQGETVPVTGFEQSQAELAWVETESGVAAEA